MKPTILLAAEAPNAYVAARLYAAAGLSVLPCTGKKPALPYWKHLQSRAAAPATIELWQKTGLLINVGIICGKVSGGLVVIDLDGEAAIAMFLGHFPDLQNTYTVTSGSGNGMHLYFFVNDVPPSTRVTGLDIGNIELHSDGLYVVAPPSIHPDTHKPYTVRSTHDIVHLQDMRPQVEWLKTLVREKHAGTIPPSSHAPIFHKSAYGAMALRDEAAEVACALPGERNNRLFRAALKMGSLITDGKIDRGTVEQELLAAARALTESDGEAATRKTIASGIDTGLRSSRTAWKNDA